MQLSGSMCAKSPASQRGMVLPVTAVSLVTLLGFAALSLDVSHLYLNKSRMQNAVDAAALSAAKDLNVTKSTTSAAVAAATNFKSNLAGPGNQELQAALAQVQPTVTFSSTVNPFVAGSGAGPYVRVAVGGMNAASWFAGVLGVDQLGVGASAVAGPNGANAQGMGDSNYMGCNLIPVVVCGDPNGDGFFGYEYGDEATLKVDSNGNGGTGEGKFNIGPGNFQLIELDDASGGADVRAGMAGKGERCLATDAAFIVTAPGNTVGPAVDGIDTRFGPCDLQGGCTWSKCDGAGANCETITLKPDMVTTTGLSYEQYVARYRAGSFDFADPAGTPERRVVTVPMGKCTGDGNGSTTVEFLGFGCFFLSRPIKHKGNHADLYGEFLEGCGTAAGASGPSANSDAGFVKFVLYKDTSSPDS